MKLNIISHICTPSISRGKWKAETGVSPEAHGLPSLECLVEKEQQEQQETLFQTREKAKTDT